MGCCASKGRRKNELSASTSPIDSRLAVVIACSMDHATDAKPEPVIIDHTFARADSSQESQGDKVPNPLAAQGPLGDTDVKHSDSLDRIGRSGSFDEDQPPLTTPRRHVAFAANPELGRSQDLSLEGDGVAGPGPDTATAAKYPNASSSTSDGPLSQVPMGNHWIPPTLSSGKPSPRDDNGNHNAADQPLVFLVSPASEHFSMDCMSQLTRDGLEPHAATSGHVVPRGPPAMLLAFTPKHEMQSNGSGI